MRLRDAVDHHPLLSKYMHCLTTADLIPREFRPSGIDQPLRSGLPNMIRAWDTDEFVLDPSRVTIYIGNTGIEGDSFKRSQLMDRYGVQINKTSRNTVLFMTTIGTTRSSVAYLIEVLVTIARELEAQLADMSPTERAAPRARGAAADRAVGAAARLQRLPPQLHRRPGLPTPRGRRAARLLPVLQRQLLRVPHARRGRAAGRRRRAGRVHDLRHALPAGLPGTGAGPGVQPADPGLHAQPGHPEVHGYRPDLGYRVYVDKALEIAATTRPAPPPHPPGPAA